MCEDSHAGGMAPQRMMAIPASRVGR
jgi:hypothetical protein